MRYEGSRPSGRDKDVPVYVFSVGKAEFEILVRLIQDAYMRTPNVFEIMPYRGRLRNMDKVMKRAWIEEVKGLTASRKRIHREILTEDDHGE